MNFIFMILEKWNQVFKTFLSFTILMFSIFKAFDSFEENKVDKFSFICNLFLLVIATITTLVEIFLGFYNIEPYCYYLENIDEIFNIIFSLIFLIIGVINFFRFLLDKNFLLKYYIKYFLVASLVNIIGGLIFFIIYISVMEKINFLAGYFIFLSLGIFRLTLLATYYLDCKQNSYNFIVRKF